MKAILKYEEEVYGDTGMNSMGLVSLAIQLSDPKFQINFWTNELKRQNIKEDNIEESVKEIVNAENKELSKYRKLLKHK